MFFGDFCVLRRVLQHTAVETCLFWCNKTSSPLEGNAWPAAGRIPDY